MDQTKNIKEEESYEFRCNDCGKLLAKDDNTDIGLHIKCSRCGSLNSIFKGVTDQVIITDSEGTILYANALVQHITGYSLPEVLGKKPSLWGGQMSKSFYKEMWQAIKVEKKPIMVLVKNKRKDGSLYHAKLNISPVFGLDKEIKLFVGIESVIEDK